ncbi:MAG: hypothetical protein R3208_08435 [Ketobacteraceae bacterium]|nr:hypothetical protein [Ketobacteraceae bacterium]
MVYLILVLAVLVVLFYFVPKRAAIILSVFAGIIAAVALGIYWQDLQEKKRFDQIEVNLSIEPDSCPDDKLLNTHIKNTSEQEIYRVHFYFNVYREGFSTAISRSYRNEVTVNKIIAPGNDYSTCTDLPEIDETIPRDELRFELERKRVWFEPPVI